MRPCGIESEAKKKGLDPCGHGLIRRYWTQVERTELNHTYMVDFAVQMPRRGDYVWIAVESGVLTAWKRAVAGFFFLFLRPHSRVRSVHVRLPHLC